MNDGCVLLWLTHLVSFLTLEGQPVPLEQQSTQNTSWSASGLSLHLDDSDDYGSFRSLEVLPSPPEGRAGQPPPVRNSHAVSHPVGAIVVGC